MQTAVSHSSTEVEIISPDAGLSLERVPTQNLEDMVVDYVRSSKREDHHA